MQRKHEEEGESWSEGAEATVSEMRIIRCPSPRSIAIGRCPGTAPIGADSALRKEPTHSHSRPQSHAHQERRRRSPSSRHFNGRWRRKSEVFGCWKRSFGANLFVTRVVVIVHGVKGNTFLEAAIGFFGGGFVDIRPIRGQIGRFRYNIFVFGWCDEINLTNQQKKSC